MLKSLKGRFLIYFITNIISWVLCSIIIIIIINTIDPPSTMILNNFKDFFHFIISVITYPFLIQVISLITFFTFSPAGNIINLNILNSTLRISLLWLIPFELINSLRFIWILKKEWNVKLMIWSIPILTIFTSMPIAYFMIIFISNN